MEENNEVQLKGVSEISSPVPRRIWRAIPRPAAGREGEWIGGDRLGKTQAHSKRKEVVLKKKRGVFGIKIKLDIAPITLMRVQNLFFM